VQDNELGQDERNEYKYAPGEIYDAVAILFLRQVNDIYGREGLDWRYYHKIMQCHLPEPVKKDY